MSEAGTVGNRVVRVSRCRLRAGKGLWPYAREKRAEIDRHWKARSRENPGFFNGTIFVLERHALGTDVLDGVLIPVEFKSFLYWKDHGHRDRSVRDCFGSALIRSAEGHVLLGRQRAGNINAGLVYLPGGFIDPRDVGADGGIDIAASINREVVEETGLSAGELEQRPGFVLTFTGAMLSIAVEMYSNLASEPLANLVRERIGGDARSELEDVVIVRSAADLDALAMPIYAEVLLRHVL